MARANQEDNRFVNPYIEKGLRLAVQEWVPADNAVIDVNMPPLLIMNPAGAIDILMPVSNAANKGLTFFMSNPSANAITLKTSGDAAFTTAIVLAAGESAWVFCTGSATAALGWRAIGTTAST
jgi:hypothetical protein